MAEHEDIEDIFDEMTAADERRVDDSHFVNPLKAVLSACLDRTFPAPTLRKINADRFCSVILEVPWASWIAAVASHVRTIFPDHAVVLVEGGRRKKSLPCDDVFAVAATRKGAFFAIVAAGGGELTEFATRTAQIRVKLHQPDLAVLRHVARLCMTGDARKIRVAPERGWPVLEELAGCFPAGAPVSVAIERLKSLAPTREAVTKPASAFPDLSELHGLDPAKAWANDLKTDLEAYGRGELEFSEIKSGAILTGPPGTGKTFFAGAVAKSCNLHFVQTSIATWFATTEGHLDDVIKAMRKTFDEARLNAPSLIFVDELDALPARDSLDKRGKSWWTPVITDFLTLLDSSLNDRAGVVVLGATNRVFDVDEAVKRSGRLSEILSVEPPDAAALEGILRYHLRGELRNENLKPFSIAMTGSTGADAAGWIRDARRAARNAGRPFAMQDLWDAAQGKETRSRDELWKVAVHEAGHCLVGRSLGYNPMYVTIRQCNEKLGETRFGNLSTMVSRSEVLNVVTTALAGMAAERLILGEGASLGGGGMIGSDLNLATETIARGYACFGWGEELAWRTTPDKAMTLLTVDREFRSVVDRQLQVLATRAYELIALHRAICEELAKQLLEHWSLDGAHLEEFFSKSGL